MNAQRMTRVMLAGAVALALAALTVLIVALPATAGPSAQDGWTPIPTPTRSPLDEVGPYKLETVGGDIPPQVFPSETVNGVTFGETTTVSEYPRQMIFSASVVSDTREIENVDLTIRLINGANVTYRARQAAESEPWTVTFSNSLYQVPPWARLEFQWCAVDVTDEEVCTEPRTAIFSDPDQRWFRVTTDHAILYWYGFGEDQTEHIARQFTREVEATHQRLVDGFGRDLSYKPIIMIYPDTEIMMATYSYFVGPGQSAVTFVRDGIAIHAPLPVDRPGWTCQFIPTGPDYSTEYRRNISLGFSVTWAITGLFIGDTLSQDVSAISGATTDAGWSYVDYDPLFWLHGQLRWFGSGQDMWGYDERLRQLALLPDFPSLTSVTTGDFGEDGCPLLPEDMGASFINWLVYNHGIEIHRQIVELMIPTEDNPSGMDFYDAIEQATGKPFAALENEWRAYLELPPLE